MSITCRKEIWWLLIFLLMISVSHRSGPQNPRQNSTCDCQLKPTETYHIGQATRSFLESPLLRLFDRVNFLPGRQFLKWVLHSRAKLDPWSLSWSFPPLPYRSKMKKKMFLKQRSLTSLSDEIHHFLKVPICSRLECLY